MAGDEEQDRLVLDEAFIARAGYREASAGERVQRAERIHAAHRAAQPWRAPPVSTPRSRSTSSRRPARRARRGVDGRSLLAVVLAAGLLAGLWQTGLLPHGAAGKGWADGQQVRSSDAVPRLAETEGGRRVLPAPAIPAGGSSYRFLETAEGSRSPLTWDPCQQIHIVTRPAGQIAGGPELLRGAFAQLSAATGLSFMDDGVTDEAPAKGRPAFQPDRYGRQQWAPVLVAWADPTEVAALQGNVAGVAGPSGHRFADGQVRYVSGIVVLDGPQLTARLASSDGPAAVRKVVLHELGHLAGLGHVDDPSQLMSPGSPGSPAGYRDGDLHGLALLGAGTCLR